MKGGLFSVVWMFLAYCYNIHCFGTFFPLLHIKLDLLTFVQIFEAVTGNSGMMDKYIFAAVCFDKAVPFLLVEPFYSTVCH